MEIFFEIFSKSIGFIFFALFFGIGIFASIRQFKIQSLEKKLMQKINWQEKPELADLSWVDKRKKYRETNKEWNEAIKKFFYNESIDLKFDKEFFNSFMKWRKRSSSNYSGIGIKFKDLIKHQKAGQTSLNDRKLDIKTIFSQIQSHGAKIQDPQKIKSLEDLKNLNLNWVHPKSYTENIKHKFKKAEESLPSKPQKNISASYAIAIVLTISAGFFVFLAIIISRENPDSASFVKHLFYTLALIDFLIAVYFYRKGSEQNY